MSVDIPSLRAAQANGVVLGVIPEDKSTVTRLEIDDLLQDAELANLYFLALQAFMDKAIYKDPFSYYEIGGIHGQPARAWDNVTSAPFPPTGEQPDTSVGYCTHGSVLFPLWHRVYVAQFEQALFLIAADIAPSIGAEKVLDRFRIPYFDPLLPRQKTAGSTSYKYGIPIIFTLPQIQVRKTDDPKSWTLINNPLYQFDFPSDDNTKQPIDWSGFDSANVPLSSEPEVKEKTIRGYDGTTQNANHTFVMKTFDDTFNPVTTLSTGEASSIWRVMFDHQDWITMSNHLDTKGNYNQNSLEGFHDNIHTYLGSGPMTDDDGKWPSGHMAQVPYAGFDPAFWLHHCNVDRLLAIWQGINSTQPESVQWWTTHKNLAGGTYVEPGGEQETPSTTLAPFRNGGDQTSPTWWTSAAARDHTALGYDYPQIVDARKTGDLVAGLTAWANDEMGWADPYSAERQPPDQDNIDHFDQQITAYIASFPSKILVDGTTPLGPDDEYISSGSTPPLKPVIAKPLLIKDELASAKPNMAASQPVPVGSVPPKGHNSRIPGAATERLNAATDQTVMTGSISGKKSNFRERFGRIKDLIASGKMTQWNASLSVEKYALDGSFFIHFFIGDFDPSPSNWLHSPTRAASSGIFANPSVFIENNDNSTTCGRCTSNADLKAKYRDTVSLTPALIHYWSETRSHPSTDNALHLQDLHPSSVIPFLQRNLHWRVVDSFGRHRSRESLPSLKIGVYSETVTLPQRLSDRPVFADKIMRHAITTGRAGGLNDGEEL